MKNKFTVVIIIMSVVNLIASLVYIFQLPETVPTHFNVNFQVDGIGSRYVGLILAILPMAVVLGILAELCIRKKDYPNRKVLQIVMNVTALFFICWNWFMLLLMDCEPVIGATPKYAENVGYLPFLALGALLTAIGNYMPTVSQNRTLGFKIKWTLENEQCWKLTHRFGGKLMTYAGLGFLGFCIIGMLCAFPLWIGFIVLLCGMLLITIVPAVYAYRHRDGK